MARGASHWAQEKIGGNAATRLNSLHLMSFNYGWTFPQASGSNNGGHYTGVEVMGDEGEEEEEEEAYVEEEYEHHQQQHQQAVEESDDTHGLSDEGVSGDDLYDQQEFDEVSGASGPVSGVVEAVVQATRAALAAESAASAVASLHLPASPVKSQTRAVLPPPSPPTPAAPTLPAGQRGGVGQEGEEAADLPTAASSPPPQPPPPSANNAPGPSLSHDSAPPPSEATPLPRIPLREGGGGGEAKVPPPTPFLPPTILTSPPPTPAAFVNRGEYLQLPLLSHTHPSTGLNHLPTIPTRGSSASKTAVLEDVALASALGLTRPRALTQGSTGMPAKPSEYPPFSHRPDGYTHPSAPLSSSLWGEESGGGSTRGGRLQRGGGGGEEETGFEHGSLLNLTGNSGGGGGRGGDPRRPPSQPYASSLRPPPPPPHPSSLNVSSASNNNNSNSSNMSMAQRALYQRLPGLIKGVAGGDGSNPPPPLSHAYASAAGAAIGDGLSTSWGREGGGGAYGNNKFPPTSPAKAHLELLKGRMVGRDASRVPPPPIPSGPPGVTDSVLLQMILLGARQDALKAQRTSHSLPSLPHFSTLSLDDALGLLTPPPISPSSTATATATATTPPGGVPKGRNPPNPSSTTAHAKGTLHPTTLAAEHSSVFEALFQHTVLQLPRLVAEAVGVYVHASTTPTTGPTGVLDRREDEERRRMLGAAVGGPVLSAIQNMLCDTDVVTLVREAVVASVRDIIEPPAPLKGRGEGGGGEEGEERSQNIA